MKQYIIIIASIVLGISIFGLLSLGDNSIRGNLGGVWQHEVNRVQETYP